MMRDPQVQRLLRHTYTAVAAVVFFALAACKEDPTEPPEPLVPTTVEVVRGGGLEVLEDAEGRDSLSVRVLDQHDDPLAGVRVTWSLLAGGGEVIPARSNTDESGEASAVWLLGAEPGDGEVEASVQELEPVLFAGLVSALPPPTATTMTSVAGDAQAEQVGSTLPDSLGVEVRDQHGEPLSGVEVTWLTDAGSVSPASSTTDEAGLARTEWTLGEAAGEAQATAMVDGLEPVTFVATAAPGPGPATAMEVVSEGGPPDSAFVSQPLPDSLGVRIVDADGVPVPGVEVSWEIADHASEMGDYTGVKISPAVSVTDDDGVARAELTAGTDPVWYLARASTSDGLDASFEVRVRLPEGSSLEAWGAEHRIVPANRPVSLSVRLLDAEGEPLPNVVVSWCIGVHCDYRLSVTTVSGIATMPNLYPFWSVGEYEVEAWVQGYNDGMANRFVDYTVTVVEPDS